VINIYNSSLKNNRLSFYENKAMSDYLKTTITINNCTFNYKGELELLVNKVAVKQIVLNTAGNVENGEGFSAKIIAGNANIKISSDLTGLKNK
jgi:hypothetical protein